MKLGPGDRVTKAVRALEWSHSPSLPVEDDGVQVGSVSGTSLIRSLLEGKVTQNMKIGDLMDSPLPAVEKGSLLLDPASVLMERGAFVVAKGSKVVGVITTADVIRYLAGR